MNFPVATYRWQFAPGVFDFHDASAVLDYLRDLGVGAVYAAPVLQAAPGSTHGYDVTCHGAFNAELGGEEALRAVLRGARARGLGWWQDIVPNHVAYTGDNPLIRDLFRYGPRSSYASFFDIDWKHPYASLRGRLLAPFLGRYYADCLRDGELRLIWTAEGFAVAYYDRRFPLRVESYAEILQRGLQTATPEQAAHPDTVRLHGIAALCAAPAQEETHAALVQRYDCALGMLRDAYAASETVRDLINAALAAYNGTPGEPDSRILLHELLGRQWFRLAFWRVANEEINYRRFFTINDLISLRVEEETVFRHTHARLLELLAAGELTGLRLDHIDGLLDPLVYLQRLRAAAPDTPVVVEKILARDETLPAAWPVQGTTGYDFLTLAAELLADSRPRVWQKLDATYAEHAGWQRTYAGLVAEKKRHIIGRHMAGNIDNLAHLVERISSRDRYGIDITMYGLKRALVELMASFPVYRTYVGVTGYDAADRAHLQAAFAAARAARPELAYEFTFLAKIFYRGMEADLADAQKRLWLRFLMLVQQFTGPLQAKGVEDTAFYVYGRCLAFNEVGCEPQRLPRDPAAVHAALASRPLTTMNATATHDTKRGEDARARLLVLTELADEWKSAVRRWQRQNRRLRVTRSDGLLQPTANDEYLLYQALLAHWPWADADLPRFAQRLQAWALKAAREAKEKTGWLAPDEEYERALAAFVSGLLQAGRGEFLADFRVLQQKVARHGVWNSLAQLTLKLTAPGIPDIYQGTEFWDLSFVDPDNRQPVDYVQRAALLADLRGRDVADRVGLWHELLARPADGRIKLWLLHRLLQERQARAALFAGGRYQPLTVDGERGKHAFAFLRVMDGAAVAVVITRLTVSLAPGAQDVPWGRAWGDTRLLLPDGWQAERELLCGRALAAGSALPLAELCATLPVAVLEMRHV